jgi:hypothetical protein
VSILIQCTVTFILTSHHRVEACSVNPIDTKVRKGTYDDAPGNNASPFCSKLSWLNIKRLLQICAEGVPYHRLWWCRNGFGGRASMHKFQAWRWYFLRELHDSPRQYCRVPPSWWTSLC